MQKFFNGFLFDMDGTLVDSSTVVESTWQKFSEQHDLDYTAVIQYAHGRRTQETVFHFLGETETTQQIAREIEVYETGETTGIIAVPGAKELLSTIRPEHYAIVTSASRELCINRLQAAKLPIPEIIVSAENVVNGKPDPEGYLLGAQLLGLNIKNVLIFEDAPAGIQAALNSGGSLAVIGNCDAGGDNALVISADFTSLSVAHEAHGYYLSFSS
ncbi:HAD-IA family hydrolase [Serratia sp. (in: enterobacteria)]|uniref:HAD-IA family hydrolase n=1 Tax=Serratia sp. (in: enterobacteria) TaxID=616 RepID=UPI003989D15B